MKVVYDGNCNFCIKSITILQKLDWLKKLEYVDFRKLNLPNIQVPITPEALEQEMHVIGVKVYNVAGISAKTWQVYKGFKAIRQIMWRLPACWPLLPLTYIPGVPFLGQKLYLKIAKNRFNLTPCKGECKIDR
jgi:predicted DCC family thiol-disulfide oxidoreductase YuxK